MDLVESSWRFCPETGCLGRQLERPLVGNSVFEGKPYGPLRCGRAVPCSYTGVDEIWETGMWASLLLRTKTQAKHNELFNHKG